MKSNLRVFIECCKLSTDSLNLMNSTDLAEGGMEFFVFTFTLSGAVFVNC